MNLDFTLSAFRSAQTLLDGHILMTPLVASPSLLTPAGHPILLKAENLQPSGSFKIRGASYCISRLTDTQRRNGVIAYSTGNHAQAVALAARQQHVPATIVMSPDVPPYKSERTRQYGATILWADPSSQARRLMAESLAAEQNLALIPPYDHQDVILGQGTIGLEIADQYTPSAVFVPIGGGGLIAGIALAIKLLNPSIQVIGVEPAWENDAWQSFHQDHLVALPAASSSIADAIRVQSIGELPYAIIRRNVDDIVTVSEAQIAAAILCAFNEAHLVLEPSGAVALAAAQSYQSPLPTSSPVVAIASGGNTTLDFMHRLGLSIHPKNSM